MVHFISKLLEFLSSRVSYCTIFSSNLSASVAPRGGAFVLANMTNPHLAPPSPVGGVVGHNIDRRINKEFWQQFQNYAPPSLRVIRTKFCTYYT